MIIVLQKLLLWLERRRVVRGSGAESWHKDANGDWVWEPPERGQRVRRDK